MEFVSFLNHLKMLNGHYNRVFGVQTNKKKAALNFQKTGTRMRLNSALFADNGSCGYVLKPDILLRPSLGFNPHDTSTMASKCQLHVRVISAQRLPRSSQSASDIADPYVRVSVHGVPSDMVEKRTKSIQDNGFNPLWNEDMLFLVNCPELAFVKFDVMDDDLIGSYCIRFTNMRRGCLLFSVDFF